jgi:hypothetical protein
MVKNIRLTTIEAGLKMASNKIPGHGGDGWRSKEIYTLPYYNHTHFKKTKTTYIQL